jgi:hypothetical protein
MPNLAHLVDAGDPAGRKAIWQRVALEIEPEVAHTAEEHADDDSERAEGRLQCTEQLVVTYQLGAESRREVRRSSGMGRWLHPPVFGR